MEVWRFFFCYKSKIFCYLWYHKKHKQPYIGIIEGHRFDEPFLVQEKHSQINIMLLDPNEDLPLLTINDILQKALNLYRTREIKIK